MPHIHEKIDTTVEVYVVSGEKVLLRKHDKLKIWLSVGGHIELDEDPNQAALREVKEEVGLDIQLHGTTKSFNDPGEYTELIPPKFLNRHRISPTHEHVTLIYFASSKSTEIQQPDREASEEIRWFTAGELDEPGYGLRENVRFYAHEALETVV